jgi:hypothetical protein
VVRPVAQVDVEHDDVIAACVGEAGPNALPHAEVPGMMNDPHDRELRGECVGDAPGAVETSVVDDHRLEPVAVFQGLEMREDVEDVHPQQRRLVVDGQHDGDEWQGGGRRGHRQDSRASSSVRIRGRAHAPARSIRFVACLCS